MSHARILEKLSHSTYRWQEVERDGKAKPHGRTGITMQNGVDIEVGTIVELSDDIPEFKWPTSN